jgi:hypothetical protein
MKTPRAAGPGVSWSKLRNAAGILRIKPPPSPHHSPYIAARLVLPVPYGGMKGGTTTDLRSPGDTKRLFSVELTRLRFAADDDKGGDRGEEPALL